MFLFPIGLLWSSPTAQPAGWLSKTRCEYIPVRSAPPSMAPQGFGQPPRRLRYVSVTFRQQSL
ncbi:hypothetical protein EHN06_18940 [Marinobacter sp. NP-4(2019)]|nr:hypothetical protein EHN06_18940 [Marinobacter sp. NP-4(2019)]